MSSHKSPNVAAFSVVKSITVVINTTWQMLWNFPAGSKYKTDITALQTIVYYPHSTFGTSFSCQKCWQK